MGQLRVDFVNATVILAVVMDPRWSKFDMKGFLQVVSLFCVPLALVIWYDLFKNTAAYQFTFDFRASRPIAIGIHLLTAFLCLHTPLRLWRRFDELSLKLFCLTIALVMFWVVVRLATSGRLDEAPIFKTVAIFVVPIFVYPLLSYFLLRWSRSELEVVRSRSSTGDIETENHGNS